LMQGAPEEQLPSFHPVYERGELPEVPYHLKTEADKLHTLEVRGLTYLHPDSDRGVRDIDLTLRRGSFTVITGQIGSGKTTLVRALLGLLARDSGEIRWNGELVEDTSDFLIPPRAAYTAQVPRLFSESLRDNLLMGLPEAEADLPAALRAAAEASETAPSGAGATPERQAPDAPPPAAEPVGEPPAAAPAPPDVEANLLGWMADLGACSTDAEVSGLAEQAPEAVRADDRFAKAVAARLADLKRPKAKK